MFLFQAPCKAGLGWVSTKANGRYQSGCWWYHWDDPTGSGLQPQHTGF